MKAIDTLSNCDPIPWKLLLANIPFLFLDRDTVPLPRVDREVMLLLCNVPKTNRSTYQI